MRLSETINYAKSTIANYQRKTGVHEQRFTIIHVHFRVDNHLMISSEIPQQNKDFRNFPTN